MVNKGKTPYDNELIDRTVQHKGKLKLEKVSFIDGTVYEGEWLNGMRHGNGKLVFKDESVYEG
jgi:hypothetical protein